MSEIISAAASQLFQQMADNQGVKQASNPAGKSFEQYLQQDKTLQTQDVDKTAQTTQTTQTQPIEKAPITSGVDLENKLAKLEADLAQKYPVNNQSQSDLNKMLPNLLDTKTRLGMLKDAYSKVGNTSKVTSDLPGRLTQVESEYNQVNSIMHSDKTLSQGELLALQARLYQVSQHIEVMSKVVDQMAGGIKTVLNTNI